jgi:hypothetical protein
MAETTSKTSIKKAASKTALASPKPAAKKPVIAKAKTPVAKPAVKPVAAKKPVVIKAAATQPAAKKPVTVKKPVVTKTTAIQPAVKTPSKAMVVSDEQRYRMVAEAAYYRAESNQFKSDPVRDWIEAESDIAALLSGSK